MQDVVSNGHEITLEYAPVGLMASEGGRSEPNQPAAACEVSEHTSSKYAAVSFDVMSDAKLTAIFETARTMQEVLTNTLPAYVCPDCEHLVVFWSGPTGEPAIYALEWSSEAFSWDGSEVSG